MAKAAPRPPAAFWLPGPGGRGEGGTATRLVSDWASERGVGREAKVMGRLEEANGVARVAGTRWVYGCFLDPNWTSPLGEGLCVCDRERGAETRHCLGARVGVEVWSVPSACGLAPLGQPL